MVNGARRVALVLLMGALLSAVAAAEDGVEVWRRWEHTLHSAGTYANPYADVTLRATYTGPGGRELHAYGFWDGGDTFRIRCAFPAAGVWRWRTASEPSDPGLSGRSGTVRVRSYRGRNPLYQHGFLRVSDDHRYLCHADGTPFLWMGDTAWAAPMHATDADWDAYLRDRVGKHFTVLQVAVAPWWAGANNAEGQPAFLGEHLERWNPAFWKSYERKIQAANESGLFVLIVGIMEPTYRYPEAPEASRFARQVAARLYGNFVAFSPSFDSGYRELGDAVGAALRDATRVHLITQHPGTPSGQPTNAIAETYFDRPYMDFAGNQSGHNGGNLELCSRQAVRWNLHLFERRPPKPVINLEAMYDTDSSETQRPNAWRGEDARRLGYQSWLSGAMGYTYGTDLYEWGTDSAKPGYWRTAMALPSSAEMRHLHDLLAGLEWWRLRPAHDRVADPPEAYLKRPLLAKTESGDQALAYLPAADAVRLNLTGFPGKVRARWYNPRSGRFVGSAEECPASAAEVFAPPGPGDWALVLTTPQRARARRS